MELVIGNICKCLFLFAYHLLLWELLPLALVCLVVKMHMPQVAQALHSTKQILF